MELNAVQVIKALECCASGNGIGACESGCPLWEIEPCPCIDEPNEILHCALALIKQLTEENESLNDANERLQNISIGYRNERNTLKDLCDTIEADTVREMQERIKTRCIKSGIYPAIVARAIDQIAKEMLEGDDA